VHLAAVSFVDHENISEIYQTNITGTRNLLSSLAKFPHITRQLRTVLLASSASVYGNSQSDPISEATPFSPGNDYAVSKVAMELMAANWANRLPITVVRPFNYTGVGQSEKFIVPKIVRAFTKKDDVIELGNVDVYRDFLDVRDVADVYLQLLESSPRGVFNICSEKVQTLRDIISTVSLLSGHAAEIRVKSHLIRASDAKIMWGSAARLRAVVPLWAPRPFTETLTWMLEQAPKISL
jgi:nucleoside-diphosphate-sugar epimerase